MTATRGFDELLTKVIAALGLIISGNQKEKLLNYIQLILEGLKKQRLVGERSGAALIEKHLYDSLYPLTTWQIPRGSLLDLGTGVGLPGIPMKICLPEQALYLLDANKKKINFLRKVALELALQEVFFYRAGLKNGAGTPAAASNSTAWSAARWRGPRCWWNWGCRWLKWEDFCFFIRANRVLRR